MKDDTLKDILFFGGLAAVGLSLWMIYQPADLKWTGPLIAGAAIALIGAFK